MAVARGWLAQHRQMAAIPANSGAAPDLARAYAGSIPIDPGVLHQATRDMYADAWLAGGKDAAEQLHVTEPPGRLAAAVGNVDWSRWKPGHARAADLLAGPGFDALLGQANVWIREIDTTTRQRVGAALETGVREGQSVQRIAREIDRILDDPARSELIAVTEVNRAMSQATLQLYRDNGVGWWDLLTASDPCPVCAAIAAHNPHPIADSGEFPPEHPRCRCSAASHHGGA